MKKIVALLVMFLMVVTLVSCTQSGLRLAGEDLDGEGFVEIVGELDLSKFNGGYTVEISGNGSMNMDGTSQSFDISVLQAVTFGNSLSDYKNLTKMSLGDIGAILGYPTDGAIELQTHERNYQSNASGKYYFDSPISQNEYTEMKTSYQQMLSETLNLDLPAATEVEEMLVQLRQAGFQIKVDDQGTKQVLGIGIEGSLADLMALQEQDMDLVPAEVLEMMESLGEVNLSMTILVTIENSKLEKIEGEFSVSGSIDFADIIGESGTPSMVMDFDFSASLTLIPGVDQSVFPSNSELATYIKLG